MDGRVLGRLVGIGMLGTSALILAAVVLALSHDRNAWGSSDDPRWLLQWTYAMVTILLLAGISLAAYAVPYLRGRRPRVVDDTPLLRQRVYYAAIALFVLFVSVVTDSEPRSRTLLWIAFALAVATFVVREVLIRQVLDGESV
jgi:hypothetical protein